MVPLDPCIVFLLVYVPTNQSSASCCIRTKVFKRLTLDRSSSSSIHSAIRERYFVSLFRFPKKHENLVLVSTVPPKRNRFQKRRDPNGCTVSSNTKQKMVTTHSIPRRRRIRQHSAGSIDRNRVGRLMDDQGCRLSRLFRARPLRPLSSMMMIPLLLGWRTRRRGRIVMATSITRSSRTITTGTRVAGMHHDQKQDGR
jgi:hypothetical protein